MINNKNTYYLFSSLSLLLVLSACKSGYLLSMEESYVSWNEDSIQINVIDKKVSLVQQDSNGLGCIWANHGYKIYSKKKHVKRIARQFLKSPMLLMNKEDSFYYNQLQEGTKLNSINYSNAHNRICTNLLILRSKKKGVAVYSDTEGQFLEEVNLRHYLNSKPFLNCTLDTLLDQVAIFHNGDTLVLADYPYLD